MEGKAPGQIRSIFWKVQQRSVSVSSDLEHLSTRLSDGPVEILFEMAALSRSSRTARTHSLALPSAQLLGFKVRAKLTGMESDKTKPLCGNLSSVGHASRGGHAYSPVSPGKQLLCLPLLSPVGFRQRALPAPRL